MSRILTALAFVAAAAALAGAEPQPAASPRVPWTKSAVTGSPEPPPKYKSVRIFPEIKFNHPLLITNCPGTDRLFVAEQAGKLYSIKPGPNARAEVFLDLPKEIKTLARTPGAKKTADYYGLAFHPRFEENRYCYCCYTLESNDGKTPYLPDGTRVSRFKVARDEPPRIDPASEEIIIAWQGGGHNGGDIHFGPDGMLYISSGDGRGPNPPDQLNTGQDCSDLLSSILRIDVDHPEAGKKYGIPRDNPFVGMKDVRPEIWAFGFRNPWRMSFDRQTGDLWVGDVGWELWEMVDKVRKGGNYGWSIVEGRQPTKPNQKVGPSPILPPTIELPHTIAASVTGGYVYRGKKFPELSGAYVFGDWETRRMWAARFEDGRLKEIPELVKPTVRIVAFGEDHAGELYFLDYDTGFVHTLERNDGAAANTHFPTTLTATGLFASAKDHAVAPGVEPFAPAVHQWQDGLVATHHVALPGQGVVTVFDKPRRLPGQVYWHDFRMQFPRDAVLVKTITLPTTGKRVETQLLHYDGEDWHGYTYAWRDDQTDAELVPSAGAEKVFSVPDERVRGGKRELVWTYHSRNQCMVCHSAWSEYALAFNVGQLNHPAASGNELARLSRQGFVRRVGKDDEVLPPFDDASAAREVGFPSGEAAAKTKAERDKAARAYLHVNCSHCHRFGGGGGQVVLEMDFARPLKEMLIVDVPPRQGDFGLPGARIVKPGDPYASVLYYRMAKFGRGRMPHLGSELPDPRGLRLLADWIEDLGGAHSTSTHPFTADGVGVKLSAPGTALPLARGVAAAQEAEIETARRVIAAAESHEPGAVRDLFEGYFPPDPRGRKLGSNPKPAAILALKGDPTRGAAIFFNKDMKCTNCHKIADKGVSLGPDLSAIGKARTRAELLESILQPSLQIEPQFASYLVQTRDEKTFTGLLVKRDDKQVVLRDAENKEIVLPADAVESVRPSRLSLMPDGLVAGLLPQEAADLVEYLATRR